MSVEAEAHSAEAEAHSAEAEAAGGDLRRATLERIEPPQGGAGGGGRGLTTRHTRANRAARVGQGRAAGRFWLDRRGEVGRR